MLDACIPAENAAGHSERKVSGRLLAWIPVGTALLYPWALRLFHDAAIAKPQSIVPAIWLIIAFALPLSCLLFAWRSAARAGDALPTVRRTAFAALAAPPLFVLTGVLSSLLHSPIRDIWIWSILWLAVGVGATIASSGARPQPPGGMPGRLRVLHGVSALAILLFVAFHLANHLTGLFGPIVHARVMAVGRVVYRSQLVEPVLVAILLLQVASGLRLAWRWSARPLDAAKVMQVGSGAYLAAFILTHLNSAFVSARWVHGTPTDWAWATGAPDGLLMDAWNIRLLPHYALGVFFVIAHLFCGLRTVLLAHGVRRSTADRAWASGLLLAGGVSLTITAALCGLRI
nr:hypothetical protein [uncultured Sphingomonas sp.]